MNAPHYSYKLRPVYNGHELLLEFNGKEQVDALQEVLFELLKDEGYAVQSTEGLWVNDEALVHFASAQGKIEYSRNNWDFIFLMAPDNQAGILRLDDLLVADPRFEKEAVNHSDYHK